MSKSRQKDSRPCRGRRESDEWPELMKLSQARKYLGVSHQKITTLVHKGILPFTYNELDHRVKLVKKTDLDALRQKSHR